MRWLVSELLDVEDAEGWRSWLKEHHLTSKEIWLVFHRGDKDRVSYGDALDEALCFGWIDSVIKKLDGERYARKFTPRRPWSIWSTLNIERVNRLRKEGRMTRWGLEAFDKRTGEKSMLEKINARGVEIPKDLELALRKDKKAWDRFEHFSPSHRKRYLIWIEAAKKPETRQRRIEEAVRLISQNVKNLLK